MRRRPLSLARLPSVLVFDRMTMSCDAIALFTFCLSEAADGAARHPGKRPALGVHPKEIGRRLGMRGKRLERALDELCRVEAGPPPLLVRTDVGYAIEDSRFIAKPPCRRKPLPRRKVFERDGFACVYCQAPVSMQTGKVDHVLPHSRGGPDTMDNLATACGPCNGRKNAKTPEEWLQ